MKPAPFRYEKPSTLDDALALLDSSADMVKVLAGGQSLIPLMNFRLARPDLLVDINGLSELAYLYRNDGYLHMGPLTRHTQLETSPLVRRHWPMLTEAIRLVGHAQIRNAGTVGGSIAHADPTAELPAALTALNASFVLQSRSGTRRVPWSEFFRDQLQTALGDDELLVEIVVPPMEPASGSCFREHAHRHGDFALGGCAATLTLGADRQCIQASIALLGAAPTPLRATTAEQALIGHRLSTQTVADASGLALTGAHPTGNVHASSGYCRELIEELVTEALLTAHENALERIPHGHPSD